MHIAITAKDLSFDQMNCFQHFLNLRGITHELAVQRPLMMTLIEVKPRKWGWCVFESPGVEPVFLEKDQAIGYAETRARLPEIPWIDRTVGRGREFESRRRRHIAGSAS